MQQERLLLLFLSLTELPCYRKTKGQGSVWPLRACVYKELWEQLYLSVIFTAVVAGEATRIETSEGEK